MRWASKSGSNYQSVLITGNLLIYMKARRPKKAAFPSFGVHQFCATLDSDRPSHGRPFHSFRIGGCWWGVQMAGPPALMVTEAHSHR
jgi:hypothetical protein